MSSGPDPSLLPDGIPGRKRRAQVSCPSTPLGETDRSRAVVKILCPSCASRTNHPCSPPCPPMSLGLSMRSQPRIIDTKLRNSERRTPATVLCIQRSVFHRVKNGMLRERRRAGGERVALERPTRAGLRTTRLMFIALAAWVLVSCTNVHCGTQGQGGGPGGCGFDLKFTTSDNPAPPGSPESRPLEQP